jgi:hypothetical protein
MSLDSIKKALAKGGEHLGDLVFWSLSEARIDRTTLESLWDAAKLPKELLPDPPSPEKALKLAVREAHVGHPDHLIRLAKEDPGEIVFAIVREQRPGDGSLDYATEARISLDRQREVLSSDSPGHDLVAGVRTRFEMYRTTHHPDDVRRAIVKALHSFAAVTLRDSGGIYWVPAPFAEKVRRLQSVIEKIGASRVYLLPVHKSAEAERALGEIAKGSIEEELASLQEEIRMFLETPPERPSTLIRRFDAFEALRARAKLYRDVLNVQVQDLDGQLNQLSAAVEEMLNQKQKAA